MMFWAKARAWFVARQAARAEQDRERRTLAEQGCCLYCPACRALLNDHIDAIPTSDDVYGYTCDCGARSAFDFSAPVPLLVN